MKGTGTETVPRLSVSILHPPLLPSTSLLWCEVLLVLEVRFTEEVERRGLEVLEVVLGAETPNKYSVKDSSGQVQPYKGPKY